MFIRKRVYRNKRGKETASCQLLESYREGGKVRQRSVVNLGRFPSLQEALDHAWERKAWFEAKPARIERMEESRAPKKYKYSSWVARVKELEGVLAKASWQQKKPDITGIKEALKQNNG